MARLSEELINCFPAEGPIHAYMQWAHRLTHTPPILHLTSIIPVIGYELCRRGFYLGEYGPPRTWFGIVAPSSIGKTYVLSTAREFSDAWYSEHFEHDALRPKPWVSLEGSLPGVLHAISTMVDSHGRTSGIFHHNEFSRVLRSDDALEPLNMIYDGKNYDRNLRYLQKQAAAGEQVQATIKSPAFSAVVTTTPSALTHVVRPDMVEGGLFQRVLWLRAKLDRLDLQPRPRMDAEGRRAALEVWSGWFGHMEAMRLGGCSTLIRCEQDAMEWLDAALFYELADLLVRESFDASVAMRAMSHASHIAAIYAASRANFQRGGIVVAKDDVIRAANLVSICLRQAQQLGSQLLAKTTDLSEKQQRLLDAITSTGTVGMLRGDAYKLFHRNLDKQQLDQIVGILTDAELVVEEVSSINQRGRPVKKLWTIEAWRKLKQNTN